MGNEQALTALVDSLNRQSIDARRSSIHAIGAIGGQSDQTLTALVDALNDDNPYIRELALDTIRTKIKVDRRNAIPRIEPLLDDADEHVRYAAEATVAEIRVVDARRFD